MKVLIVLLAFSLTASAARICPWVDEFKLRDVGASSFVVRVKVTLSDDIWFDNGVGYNIYDLKVLQTYKDVRLPTNAMSVS
ncbi:hypothetical protein ANCCAN_19898 [Ancylostoma caninum]|uniref:Transthyretin-like family protein n=1 Tax=Ancylostoma caninum TaxID=29170 RepID=A0A368FTC6_ANCCA|nr:hypothetical protein ANCCAN_19898 [Ancylostoma caninum]